MPGRIVPLPAVLILLMPAECAGLDRPRAATPPKEVTITLVGRAGDLGQKVVNFGLPLPPGFLYDADLVRVYGADDTEVEAAVRSLEPWRIDGKNGAIRSLQIQFRADFRRQLPSAGQDHVRQTPHQNLRRFRTRAGDPDRPGRPEGAARAGADSRQMAVRLMGGRAAGSRFRIWSIPPTTASSRRIFRVRCSTSPARNTITGCLTGPRAGTRCMFAPVSRDSWRRLTRRRILSERIPAWMALRRALSCPRAVPT